MHIKMLSLGIFVQMKILGGWNAGLETYQVQNTNDINVSCVFTAVNSIIPTYFNYSQLLAS